MSFPFKSMAGVKFLCNVISSDETVGYDIMPSPWISPRGDKHTAIL
jgi:hypothetical protein